MTVRSLGPQPLAAMEKKHDRDDRDRHRDGDSRPRGHGHRPSHGLGPVISPLPPVTVTETVTAPRAEAGSTPIQLAFGKPSLAVRLSSPGARAPARVTAVPPASRRHVQIPRVTPGIGHRDPGPGTLNLTRIMMTVRLGSELE
jgi:hypothetical protein